MWIAPSKDGEEDFRLPQSTPAATWATNSALHTNVGATSNVPNEPAKKRIWQSCSLPSVTRVGMWRDSKCEVRRQKDPSSSPPLLSRKVLRQLGQPHTPRLTRPDLTSSSAAARSVCGFTSAPTGARSRGEGIDTAKPEINLGSVVDGSKRRNITSSDFPPSLSGSTDRKTIKR